jgi:hypothetical protein
MKSHNLKIIRALPAHEKSNRLLKAAIGADAAKAHFVRIAAARLPL